MIFFKKRINCYFRKTCIFIKSSGVNKNLLIVLLILIMLSQVSCGLFYAENVKKINSGGASLDKTSSLDTSDSKSNISSDANAETSITSGSDSSSVGDDNKNRFENENYANPAFTVSEVIDGDTIYLKNNMRLRLIGINTPEKEMYFFEEAKVFMEILVLGKQVKLEKDVTNKDMYG